VQGNTLGHVDVEQPALFFEVHASDRQEARSLGLQVYRGLEVCQDLLHLIRLHSVQVDHAHKRVAVGVLGVNRLVIGSLSLGFQLENCSQSFGLQGELIGRNFQLENCSQSLGLQGELVGRNSRGVEKVHILEGRDEGAEILLPRLDELESGVVLHRNWGRLADRNISLGQVPSQVLVVSLQQTLPSFSQVDRVSRRFHIQEFGLSEASHR